MVSLVLFTVAIGGALAVAVSMSNGFREQRQVIATEGAVRGPMEFLGDVFRGASPAVSSGVIQDVATCTLGAITVVNSTNSPDQIDVVYASGSVVTSSRTAYTTGTSSVTVNDASQLAVDDTILITDLTQGHLVKITAVNIATGVLALASQSCTLALPASGGYPVGSLVIRAQRARFSVGTVDGIPTLMMDPDAAGTAAAAEPLAEGIEDMQIALGVDVNASGGIESTEWAYSSGTGALVGAIRAVRVTLVGRNVEALKGGTAGFYRPAAEDRPASSGPDKFRRRTLTTTIEIRNLGGSP